MRGGLIWTPTTRSAISAKLVGSRSSWIVAIATTRPRRRLGDEKLLQNADQAWRKLVAAEPDLEPNPALAGELDRIVAAARKELLTS